MYSRLQDLTAKLCCAVRRLRRGTRPNRGKRTAMINTHRKWFSSKGNLLRGLPEDCCYDCSRPGNVEPSIDYWLAELDFQVPRQLAIDYLIRFGAWPRDSNNYQVGLNDMNDGELAGMVLWIAAGSLYEGGAFAWPGLV